MDIYLPVANLSVNALVIVLLGEASGCCRECSAWVAGS